MLVGLGSGLGLWLEQGIIISIEVYIGLGLDMLVTHCVRGKIPTYLGTLFLCVNTG